ncbi:MAG: hypothetical protein R3E54_09745 [Halioglobus sp.]
MKCASAHTLTSLATAAIMAAVAPHSTASAPEPQLDRSSGYAGYQRPGSGNIDKGNDTGLSYDPEKATPGGYTDDEPYDPYYDRNHPLKNPDRDPGKGWERKDKRAKADGSFGALAASVDWDWGERYFNDSFIVVLHVTNNCKSRQPTSIFVSDVPGLTFPSRVSVPPGPDGLDVIGKVTLPSPPIPTGLPGEPPMGHVEFPPHFVPPGQPALHQPNAVAIGGEVVAWHPEAMDIDGQVCYATRITYRPAGHIHWRPPGETGDSGPSRLATTDPCTVWWNTGEQPAAASEEACSATLQALATHFIDHVLPPFMSHAPADWAWLRAFGDVKEKSASQLVAMKVRAGRVAEDTRW